jgi:transcriptional regulator with XRE-family HTH domain
MTMTLGEHIREARTRYGMSQAELARRVGISKTAMNDIEQGKTANPGVVYIIAIADTLRLSVDALLGRTVQHDHAEPAVLSLEEGYRLMADEYSQMAEALLPAAAETLHD